MHNFIKRRSSSIRESTLPENIRKGFEKFQKDDGVPVYLKSGLSDVLLFRFTAIMVVIGFLQSVHQAYTMAFPAKKKWANRHAKIRVIISAKYVRLIDIQVIHECKYNKNYTVSCVYFIPFLLNLQQPIRLKLFYIRMQNYDLRWDFRFQKL